MVAIVFYQGLISFPINCGGGIGSDVTLQMRFIVGSLRHSGPGNKAVEGLGTI